MDAGIQHSSVSKCCRSVVRSGKDSEKTPHLTCSMWDFEVPPVYLLYYTNSARCFYVQYYANFYHLHDCKGLFLQHFNSSNIECLNTLKKKSTLTGYYIWFCNILGLVTFHPAIQLALLQLHILLLERITLAIISHGSNIPYVCQLFLKCAETRICIQVSHFTGENHI